MFKRNLSLASIYFRWFVIGVSEVNLGESQSLPHFHRVDKGINGCWTASRCLTTCWDHFKSTDGPATRLHLGRRPTNTSTAGASAFVRNQFTLDKFKCFGQNRGDKGVRAVRIILFIEIVVFSNS